MSIELQYPPITIGAGIGVSVGSPVRRDREYVVGPTGYGGPAIPQALDVSFDALSRSHGLQVYEAMLCDPAVESSFDVLRLGVVSTGLKLAPAVAAEPGADPTSDPDAAKADEVKGLCERALAQCDTWIDGLAFELLEAMAFGSRVAEIVWRVVESGPDAGRLFPARLKTKPKGSVSYVVDATCETLAIQARSADSGTQVNLPVDKFVVFTWAGRDGDPRGSSILRSAFDAWCLKIATWPELNACLQQFGSPGLIGVTAECEGPKLPETEDGVPIEGAVPISAQAYLSGQLVKFKNGRVLVVPFGTAITVVGGQGDGSAFKAAIELFDRQIVLAILKNTRTTLEAKHGSKADGEVGQDVTGLTISWGRRALASVLRDQLLWRIVEANLGREDADRFTPLVTFGDAQQQDVPAIAKAISDLMRASFFTETQLPHADAMLGLPPRSPGEARVKTAAAAPTTAGGAPDQPAEPDADEAPPDKQEPPK